jgi:hypothetical protein
MNFSWFGLGAIKIMTNFLLLKLSFAEKPFII